MEGSDLFAITSGPELDPVVDDPVEADASVRKLERCDIDTVYPGHGKPSPIAISCG